MQITWPDVVRVTYTLDPSALQRFLRGTLQRTYAFQDDEQVSSGDLLCVLVYDWLNSLGVFTDQQQCQLVRHFEQAFLGSALEIDNALQRGAQAKLDVYSLVIADMRWATFSGHQHFLDLNTFAVAEALEQRIVTHIFCDLTVLYCNALERIAKKHGQTRRQSDPSQHG